MYLPTPPRSSKIRHKVNFKRSLTGLNSTFSFYLIGWPTMAKESLPYYLRIAGERIVAFITFSRALALWEMQTASTRFWTRVALSISNDHNHGHLLILKMLLFVWTWFYLWFPIPPVLSNPLGTVPSAPTTVGITVTVVCHSVFSSVAKSNNLTLCTFFSPCVVQWNNQIY